MTTNKSIAGIDTSVTHDLLNAYQDVELKPDRLTTRIVRHVANWTTVVVKRLFTSAPVVSYARPVHRDIHLNSASAISIWLTAIDHPIHSDIARTQTDGGGTSPVNLE